MPQNWQLNWPLTGFDSVEDDEFNVEQMAAEVHRNGLVHTLGNLTLLTQALNSTVSNGPYSVKMPAVRAHASLALNRELANFDEWNEDTISERGAALFEIAKKIWGAPLPPPSNPTI